MDQAPRTDASTLRVAFVPTVDDQLEVSRSLVVPVSWRWRWPWAVAALVMGGAVLERGPEILLAPLGVVLAGGLALWGLGPGMRILARRRLVRLGRENPAPYARTTFEFGAEGLRVGSELGTTEVPWMQITRVQETKEIFFFYGADDRVLFLPRRALGEGDEARLRTLLPGYLGTELTKPVDDR
jgi:hypothetical protein